MPARYPSLLEPPLGFARRGGRAVAAESTLEAFRRALDGGAPGLESHVWLCADGEPVLHHGPVVRSGVRRRPLRELPRSRLPPSIPSLAEVYDACGTAFQLSLDVHDDAVPPVVVAVAREAGAEAPGRLWLCSSDWQRAASWRKLSTEVHVVNSTSMRRIAEGPERRASALAAAGVDAVDLPERDWSPGLTTLFHRFGRLAFASGAQHRRQLDALLAMGVDAVYSDQVDRMVEALGGHPDSTPQE